ncbi:glycosyltransferase family 32 protein [Acinetobacter sp. HY1485]|uniref:glycosyltransferase family 32 protein n=1 Tax=Acinetobacter sp. HY1485 TaxID=2970918 RepID=UPI0022B971D4|nr:capsular polysaccharide synthesis protein [Acinetobacter sp. HY1485]
MKIFKKLYYACKFKYLFMNHKWVKSEIQIDNFADKISLYPMQKNESSLPKIIWIYWQGECPDLVQACLQKIQKENLDYQVLILNPENMGQYSQVDWTIYSHLTPQQKADLLRFDLLYAHGGIWLDASILLYQNLDWINHLLCQEKTAIFAYYRAKNTIHSDYPVIENWLLAARPKQEFFKAWFDELAYALKISPQQYIADIKQQYENPKEIFQEIGNLEYLIAYVACQKIMRCTKPSITVINCDENALSYQVKNRWVKEKVLIELAISTPSIPHPYLIKLTKKERNYLSKFYQHQYYFKGSLLDLS